MDEEFLRDLEQLRRYGSGLQDLMSELQRLAPERSEGADSTGSVRVILGPDGTPETIRVGAYWKEKLQPAAIAGAVNGACQAAMQKRGAEWAATMERVHWRERLEALDDSPAGGSSPGGTPAGQVPAGFRRQEPPPAPAFNPDEVDPEDVLQLADAALNAELPDKPLTGRGASRDGMLEIQLGQGGQVACRIDPRWAAGRSGAQLSEALATALAAARKQLAAAKAARSVPIKGLYPGAERLYQQFMSPPGGPQRNW